MALTPENIFLALGIPPTDPADTKATQYKYRTLCFAIAKKTLTDRQVHDTLVEDPLTYMFHSQSDGKPVQLILRLLAHAGYFQSLEHWLCMNHEDILPAVYCSLKWHINQTKHILDETATTGFAHEQVSIADSGMHTTMNVRSRFYYVNDDLHVAVARAGLAGMVVKGPANSAHTDKFQRGYALFQAEQKHYKTSRKLLKRVHDTLRDRFERNLTEKTKTDHFQIATALSETADALEAYVVKENVTCNVFKTDGWCCAAHREMAYTVHRRMLPATPKRKRLLSGEHAASEHETLVPLFPDSMDDTEPPTPLPRAAAPKRKRLLSDERADKKEKLSSEVPSFTRKAFDIDAAEMLPPMPPHPEA